jgi:hypothetical protein
LKLLSYGLTRWVLDGPWRREAAHLSRAGQFCDARLRPAGKSI